MAPCPPDAAPALLDLLVCLGLAEYAEAIEDPDPALTLLRQQADTAARRAGLAELAWPAQRDRLARILADAPGALPALARHLGLTAPDLFLAGLAAGCERHRTLALAIAALQAPTTTARPTVHLALDVLQTLFADAPDDALDLAAGGLVESGLLTLDGEDALPQRVLAIRLPLWRALVTGIAAWPGARRMDPAEPAGAIRDETSQPVVARPAATLAASLAASLAAGEAGGIVIRGPPGSGRAAIAVTLARHLGLVPIEVPVAVFREDRAFATACRCAGWLPVLRLATTLGDAADLAGVAFGIPVCVLAGTHGAVEGDRLIDLPVTPPSAAERLRLWAAALGDQPHAVDSQALTTAVLYPGAIAAIGRTARLRAAAEARPVAQADIAEARLALAPDGLGRLAHPVVRRVGPDALVASAGLAEDLNALIGRCRRRETVWQALGPSLAASQTRGVRALFAGESGTGKTMAASYIATALGAPLYRCDLGAVMNKYIGESEKNLGGLLDLAEAADVMLLFDEADALFGRRTEGGETGERYANMLTNYLLTRLEAHNGIVILTTNSKTRIDPAFWRRLDHVVDFPVPDYAERLALWRSHLGDRAPHQSVLEQLAAYCDLAGGGVRNAVLAAAAIAPVDGPIGLDSLTRALQREYAKLRRTLPAGLALVMRAAAE
ncbi:AAA family ATPase [Rhodopila sp.]|uniref:AAA family ATPase n=1 Tax=Rhodopila sp. TaxID=2480087 RepID=UPI002BC9FDA8|nr:AAA family ATPase [Rhodopila sp.]HVZ08885.1 AAA family ATPase [Rhodopila sp.]